MTGKPGERVSNPSRRSPRLTLRAPAIWSRVAMDAETLPFSRRERNDFETPALLPSCSNVYPRRSLCSLTAAPIRSSGLLGCCCTSRLLGGKLSLPQYSRYSVLCQGPARGFKVLFENRACERRGLFRRTREFNSTRLACPGRWMGLVARTGTPAAHGDTVDLQSDECGGRSQQVMGKQAGSAWGLRVAENARPRV
jgi:hypothetical protein